VQRKKACFGTEVETRRCGSCARSLLALSLLVLTVACGPSEPRSGHVLRYPLVAYQTDHLWRTQTEGRWEATWLRVRDTSFRALVAREGMASFVFRLDELAGGELRARVGLLATGRSSAGTARFVISVLHAATDQAFATLFDERIGLGPLRELRLRLPGDAFRLRLDVFPDEVAVASAAWPVWLEPRLERAAPRPIHRPDLPSVLLVTVDTLRADVLGSYGGSVPTPALDRLVRRGVRFDEAHAVAFGTTPSHASLLTSRPASRHGVRNNLGVLRRDEVSLAEVLAAEGYHTGAFVSGIPLSRRLNLSQGFDLYDDAFIYDIDARLGGTGLAQRRADRTREQLFAWLDAVPRDEPFFAWVHWFDPHQPYDPPQSEPQRDGQTRLLRPGPLLAQSKGVFERASAEAWERYQGEVAFVDLELGLLLDRVEQRGDVIVIFTADHGETFLDRAPALAFDHTTLHREITRVPLVISGLLGSIEPGVFERLVASTDIAPTVLGMLGIESPAPFEGVDLGPWLSPARPDVAPHPFLRLEGAGGAQLAIRTPDWLYRVARSESPRELRALGFEPGRPAALHSLAADPEGVEDVSREHAEQARVLASLLVAGEAEAEAEAALELDPAHREALEELGYLDP